ncbi:MAG: DUF4272 domain-containing protein [Pseudomonadota bacterium]
MILAGLAVLGAGLWFARAARAQSAPSRDAQEQAFAERYPGLPADSLARRARSNRVMQAEHVQINEWLPVIASAAQVSPPSTEEVTMRAVATMAVAMKGEGLDQSEVDAVVRDYGLAPWLTPEERAFLADPATTAEDRGVHSWRYEAANILFWAIGFVDRLDGPRVQCDPAMLAGLLRSNSRTTLLAKARLRPMAEILDQADLIYRYRWALTEARVRGRPPPAGLSDDIAMERHHAFNWLVRHADEAWDDITLDT